jgi:CBS domain containing-hemolysin-like protein
MVTKVNDDEYIISGYASLHNLTDVLEIENENIQTVSGFVMELFERIPEEKEIFENEKIKIEVLSMNNRRIEQIRLNIKEELVTEEQ